MSDYDRFVQRQLDNLEWMEHRHQLRESIREQLPENLKTGDPRKDEELVDRVMEILDKL